LKRHVLTIEVSSTLFDYVRWVAPTYLDFVDGVVFYILEEKYILISSWDTLSIDGGFKVPAVVYA